MTATHIREIRKWTDGVITFIGTIEQWQASSYCKRSGFWEVKFLEK